MADFYNRETKEPIKVMYFASNRKGAVVLRAPDVKTLGMRAPQVNVVIGNGPGKAQSEPTMNPRPGEHYFTFTELTDGATIVALDSRDRLLAQIPVKSLPSAGSYKSIDRRFNSRGMKIDLDSHIEYVCYASDIVGEGIAFRPKSAAEFKTAIKDAQLFHHDDRSDPFGKAAASATIGEGYREVSTPSLHVAISDLLSSVHIDSYAFLIRGPWGETTITPDVGQHIFDELLFRMPMPWLRRKGHPYIASVLQALHPVLPNSTNRYSPILGLRVTLGDSPQRDLKAGVPRFLFETTYNVGFGTQRRLSHEAVLRVASGGNAKRGPDWVLSIKGKAECRDLLCRDHQETVGLYFTAGGN